MSLFNQLKLLRGGANLRRTRKTAEVTAAVEFFETSRLVSILIFIVTVAAIVLISFVGVSTITLPVLPNQLAAVRINASETFTYESAERSRQAREDLLMRVPSVYQIELGPYQQFATHLHELLADLEKFEQAAAAPLPAFHPTQTGPSLAAIVDTFNAKGPYRADTDDVTALLAAGDAKVRATLVENGLLALREIYREGVYDPANSPINIEPNAVSMFQIRRSDGSIGQVRVQSLDDAFTFLRINLAAEGLSRESTLALFRLFRNGLTPNLVNDPDATTALRQRALENLRPVRVTVEQGQTIIEPGKRVTPEQYEMLVAQRQFLLDSGSTAVSDNLQLFGRMLLVLAMVLASVFYIRLEDPETLQSNGRLGLLALVVIFNLALVRSTYNLGELDFFIRNPALASLLPYLAPTALAPLIVAILIDYGSAIFMALLISIFTGVIYGSRLDLLVITFLASMVGIFACRAIRKRGKVVRAAGLGGLTVAIFALLIGISDQQPALTVLQQMLAGSLTGLLTGVAVAGLLPILEGLFKRTTDITLLELTDYNHPLLRLMQMESPGTYHHSLVVAQLSENAANAIGANPLLARVCSLFHDIGKTTKPEYFTENQRDGLNPHAEKNPSFSALIIKSHVKEGVDLAVKHRLPRMVTDVIQQHHGTTLIQYFYLRAKGATTAPFPKIDGTSAAPFPFPPATGPGTRPCEVSENTYRYDGPKPQFRESAIIMLADATEAASRSLRKVTPQALGELIDQIFHDRIDDHQLDEAPLTFEDIAKIKSSFTFTLLNMLHSRVAYPPEARPETPDARAHS